ncbi:class I histocompatibility antigen, F10 alpha chain-like [Engraulis encrasicolus]|uniref:class I histocompatibility antigen, F10 alpha chain-like n=1 Tax=Engraulis encrasicolus TaxID=184585 RepID=UPI002FCEEDB7
MFRKEVVFKPEIPLSQHLSHLRVNTLQAECCAQESARERNSLYYVYTALSKPVSAPGIFEFTAMGLLDGVKIDYYNSVDKVKVPQQDWMKAKLPADYWEKGTQSRVSKEQWFKVNINILMERMGHNTSDLHTLMWIHGCEAVGEPGASLQFVKGVDEYAYDGLDFLSFDDDSMQWVAPVNAALLTKRKWDDVPILNQYTKGYLEKECVEWMDKFLTYGDQEFQKRLTDHPPIPHLLIKHSRPSSDRYKLTCMATSFYPKDIKISILKDDWPECDGHLNDVLPNGDGTYQVRVSVTASKSQADAYQCKVAHGSLSNPIVVKWNLEVTTPQPLSTATYGATRHPRLWTTEGTVDETPQLNTATLAKTGSQSCAVWALVTALPVMLHALI